MSTEEKHVNRKTCPVPIFVDVSREEFLTDIYTKRFPAILRGLDIGSAKEKWKDVDYLADTGGPRPVKIHVSPTPQMDFINKNFVYRSLPFDEFVRRASEEKHTEFFISEPQQFYSYMVVSSFYLWRREPGYNVPRKTPPFPQTEKYYLRALGDDVRKDVADISVQFPDLAADLIIPDLYPKDKFFSSVFRIASKGLQLWTHYDVMDNVLIQISGKKKVVLFSPTEAQNIYLSGDKSEVLDIDNPDLDKFPKFQSVCRHESELLPGDVLFIPALWFHNVVSLGFGIAVNVFWKHLDDAMYDHKDTYGNKDLQPATRAMQIVDRAIKALEELPDSYKDFYARRIMCKLEQKCLVSDDNT